MIRSYNMLLMMLLLLYNKIRDAVELPPHHKALHSSLLLQTGSRHAHLPSQAGVRPHRRQPSAKLQIKANG